MLFHRFFHLYYNIPQTIDTYTEYFHYATTNTTFTVNNCV